MSNTTLNATTVLLCPSLPIEVTSIPYFPNATAQAITLLTCILNGISCPVATVENLLVFVVVLRNRSLRTVFNTSVLCLAFTDLLIAMFIQPAFIAYQAGKLYFEIKKRAVKPGAVRGTSEQDHIRAIKATRTILIITGAFFACFAPILCASIVHQAGVVGDAVVFHIVYPLAECALFLTALINPAIYVWRNASVRKSLKEFTKFTSN
ncbi:hypothetical protein OS493_017858 [Desmophyllum pertusum]|uniref:G-protein coupled receptors family 1 profile domain-containing protein n=1 Tax=Desmophyllum pertusum TaxID=174260 RepID=A0A9W9YZW5_9CNID|nr:hypothetical protein OS493_017858 [Desmophyllum pertusum]